MSTTLQTLTDDELVDRFGQLALRQHRTLESDDSDAYNALYDQMQPIEFELKRRGRSRHARLMRLLSHSNITVRLETARRLMETVPEEARPVLEEIRTSGQFPHVGDAGMLLAHYDSKA